MEVLEVDIEGMSIIPSGTPKEELRLRRSGFSKVVWRKIEKEIPPSQILPNGVSTYI